MKRVAIQGIKGSYSEQAARQMLGAAIDVVECLTFESAVDAVVNGESELAVVPIENKITGRIEPAASLIENCRLKIEDQCQLAIEHLLIGTPSASFEDLVSVSSHPQALKQCGNFLDRHPRLHWMTGSDTASCVKAVTESGNDSMAAIGSRRAAEIYGGTVVRENIADEAGNWTRFVLVERL
jgi:prephenate dehydratase